MNYRVTVYRYRDGSHGYTPQKRGLFGIGWWGFSTGRGCECFHTSKEAWDFIDGYCKAGPLPAQMERPAHV